MPRSLALLPLLVLLAACSSGGSTPGDGCVGDTAAELKTCAAGTTVSGVDVSSYQGTVSFTKVKAAGRAFVFTRISDGVNTLDSTFATNWPAMKSAGLVRGAYQFFRPGQDPTAQANLVVSKLTAAGGLLPGDLPPVLDLETADGIASATVRAHALTWLQKVEAATGVKPLVYTAAFMSDVIGTSFGGYTLWVANYGTTCPTMPSGWTDWKFWQDTDDSTVSGISGATDTDKFNGPLADLLKLTIQAPSTSADAGAPPSDEAFPLASDGPDVIPGGNTPNDGSQGATLGSGTPAPAEQTNGATITPCH